MTKQRITAIFRQECREWHKERTQHNYLARARVYRMLIERYGMQAVMRHVKQISAALDTIEESERIDQYQS